MELAKRLNGIGEYYFSKKLREIDEMNKAGKDVINLGIGSPDLPPHPEVIRVLQEESAKPQVHGYQSYKGAPVFRKAVSNWYLEWYGVELDPDTEILPLIGSKEGIMHICMTYLNEGDIALVPNPGYPTYRSAVTIAGGQAVNYDLREENNYHPDLSESIFQHKDIKLLFLNYPHMPTGQAPDMGVLQKIVSWANEHGVLIIHDNPYSFILNDLPQSLLSLPGAKNCVLELNSLSKSQNMAGWRVGMLCGDPRRIQQVLTFKSNMDSGMFLPVQLAAAKALSLGADWYKSINELYGARRQKAREILDRLGCSYDDNQVGMFQWASLPSKYKDGFALSDDVLYNANVFITPGGIFGSAGDKYVRISLCSTEQKMAESIDRIAAAKL